MATRFLIRRLPRYHLRQFNHPTVPTTSTLSPFLRRQFSSPVESLSSSNPNDDVWTSELGSLDKSIISESKQLSEAYRDERGAKNDILKDVEGIKKLVKDILHSGRYQCGDTLSCKDEKEVVEKLLAYHPHRDDKIGCGLDSIMVDYHPVYKTSRCLFVVRTDCSAVDFSYKKCLASYNNEIQEWKLFPVAPLLMPHYSAKECIVSGYKIPKNTILLMNVWAVHREPNVWENPNEFKSERFESGEAARDGYKFMPFGVGRTCPGATLGLKLVGLVLAVLIQCFDWERAGSELEDLSEGFGKVTLPKSRPLEAMHSPRPSMVPFLSQL